jgi:F-type H+-transporting ATPase subunit b
MIEARRELASKNINDAERAKKEAYERLMEAESQRMEAYIKAEEILKKYNEKGRAEFDGIIGDAKKHATKILNKAKDDARLIQTQLKIDANRRIANVSLLTTRSILKKEIDEKTNAKFVTEFIKKLEDKKYQQGEAIK